MIVLHHLNNGRAQRILWLLEELGVTYEVKKYQRLPNQKAPPSLLEVHPLGKAPVIEDTSEGIVLAESTAIITYLIQKYGGSRKVLSAEGALDDLYYTSYAECTLIPLMILHRKLFRFANSAPWYVRPIFHYVLGAYSAMYCDPEIPKNIRMIEEHLSKSEWFARGADGPTSADYAMIRGVAILIQRKLVTIETHPAIVKYAEKVQARPAYRAASKKGGEQVM